MRSRSNVPIILMFEPFLSERYREQLPKGVAISNSARDLVFEALQETVENAGAICLFQPEDTITDAIFSPQKFATGSRRLVGEEKHDASDVTHLNSTYGAIALKEIKKALG